MTWIILQASVDCAEDLTSGWVTNSGINESAGTVRCSNCTQEPSHAECGKFEVIIPKSPWLLHFLSFHVLIAHTMIFRHTFMTCWLIFQRNVALNLCWHLPILMCKQTLMIILETLLWKPKMCSMANQSTRCQVIPDTVFGLIMTGKWMLDIALILRIHLESIMGKSFIGKFPSNKNISYVFWEHMSYKFNNRMKLQLVLSFKVYDCLCSILFRGRYRLESLDEQPMERWFNTDGSMSKWINIYNRGTCLFI